MPSIDQTVGSKVVEVALAPSNELAESHIDRAPSSAVFEDVGLAVVTLAVVLDAAWLVIATLAVVLDIVGLAMVKPAVVLDTVGLAMVTPAVVLDAVGLAAVTLVEVLKILATVVGLMLSPVCLNGSICLSFSSIVAIFSAVALRRLHWQPLAPTLDVVPLTDSGG